MVYVLDSSSLIRSKGLIPSSDQWAAFKKLEDLVDQGNLAMPRQVINEVSEMMHPDLPGAWAPGVRSRLQYPLDPDYKHIQRVMADAGEVVDPNKTSEDADPWVAALALHLRAQGLDARVVTEDHLDKGSHIALTTACERLGIPHLSMSDFLATQGINIRPAQS